jgi:hypothetical protein
MRRRSDCGCGETPTVEALIAAARASRVPIIRPRTPPPARFSASMRGWLRWSLTDRAGREAGAGEQPNLILDQGLDQIAVTQLMLQQGGTTAPATFFPIIRYAAVGTDNTAPAVAQTALGAEIGRTGSTFASDSFTRPSNGVYEITRSIEFDFNQANGNLTEWGFSWDSTGPGQLFNRELFRDGLGDPEVVTKTDEFKLRLIYTLEIALSPVVMTPGSFTITGVGVREGDYMLVGAGFPTTSGGFRCIAPDLKAFSALARGSLGTAAGLSQRSESGSLTGDGTDRSGVAYSDQITQNGANTARDVEDARDAYVPGSFERTGGSWMFGTDRSNLDPIRAFLLGGSEESWSSGTDNCWHAGYVFDLDLSDEFSKDDEHTLRIGCPVVSWGRAGS